MEANAFRSLLVIDDDAVSILAVRRALRDLGEQGQVHGVATGQAGIDLLGSLLAEGRAETGRLLVLLDLNMAGMTGREFLDEIRTNSTFGALEIFVFSPDGAASLSHAQNEQVAGYLCKDNLAGTLHAALAQAE